MLTFAIETAEHVAVFSTYEVCGQLFFDSFLSLLIFQGSSMYFPSAEKTAASQSSASTPHSQSNPPPFAPLTSLVPYRNHSA